jgi:hypothetical protein
MLTLTGIETFPTENDALQLYMAKFHGRQVIIEPESSVLLPVTFVPKIPSPATREVSTFTNEKLKPLSKAAIADLHELIGSDFPNATLQNEVHSVKTTIVVQTSRGTLHTHVDATAVAANQYRVPHTITFYSDGYVSGGDSLFDQKRLMFLANNNHWSTSKYEYDIYIDNPFDDLVMPMHEIYASRPDFVTVSFQHDGKNRFNNCGPYAEASQYCNIPKGQGIEGPLIIAPSSIKNYVCTLSIDPLQMDRNYKESETMSLGHLAIVTQNITLSVMIEHIRGGPKPVDFFSANEETASTEYNNEISDRKGLKIDESYSQLSHQQPNEKDKLPHTCDSMLGTQQGLVGQRPMNEIIYVDAQLTENKVILSSKLLDFGILSSSAKEEKHIAISIKNNGDMPISLMREKVTVDFRSDEMSNTSTNGTIHLSNDDNHEYSSIKASINVKIKNKANEIHPGDKSNYSLFISLASDSIMESGKDHVYHGSILLYFGRSEHDYSEWRNTVIHDPYSSQDYMLEISFKVKVMNGNISYYANEVHFPLKNTLALPGRKKIPNSEKKDKKCSNNFLRTLHIKNEFLHQTLRLTGFHIHSDNRSLFDCQKYFKIYDFEGSNFNKNYSHRSVAGPEEFWGGITLFYQYPKIQTDRVELNACSLVLETEQAGNFPVPLSLYSGTVAVETERSIVPMECVDDENGIIKNGMDCLITMKNLRSFDAMLSSSMRNLFQKNNDKNLVAQEVGNMKKYFSTLSNKSSKTKHHVIEPVVLSLGSMSSNVSETHSLYLKNFNPVPLNITAVVSAMEGLEIRLGREAVNLMDYVETANPLIKGDSFETNDWLKNYLNSKGGGSDMKRLFYYRDDVSLINEASTELKQLYHNSTKLHFHVSNFMNQNHEKDEIPEKKSMNMQPPSFALTQQLNTSRTHASPILISPKSAHPLKSRGNKNIPSWIIPPGGTMRLELLVRSPPKHFFDTNNIVDILTMGLILETNFGEILPIVVSYRSLSGRLQTVASHQNSTTDKFSIVAKPMMQNRGSNRKLISSIQAESVENENTLVVKNTFSTDVLLRKVYSCNKWFDVHLVDEGTTNNVNSLPFILHRGETVRLTVRSSIHCPRSTAQGRHSFFHCALNWLEKKHPISSDECNGLYYEYDQPITKSKSVTSDTYDAILNTITIMKEVTTFLDERYGRVGVLSTSADRRKHVITTESDMNLSEETEQMFQKAFGAWKHISKIGLNTVIGNVRAQFDLLPETNDVLLDDQPIRTIATDLEETNLKTELDVPRLFDFMSMQNITNPTKTKNFLNFGVVTISKTSKMFIPVVNPSGFPIIVRLLSYDPRERGNGYVSESQIFVPSKKSDKHHWWTGGSYFNTDDKGDLLMSNHNVTIETSSGSSLSLLNPSLHSSSAFTHGCTGRRCGGSFPISPHQAYKDEIQQVSSIGASSSKTSFLSGRLYSASGAVERVQSRASPTFFYPPFAMSANSINEITIPPFGSAKLGPIFFRPPSRNNFKAKVFIENSLTGLEKVRVEGSGGYEKITFIENTVGGQEGQGNLETRYNKPTLMFTRTNGRHHRSIKSILIANVGDSAVRIVGVRISEADMNQPSFSDEQTNQCKRRGFTILDCIDANGGNDPSNSTNLLDGFSLQPKDARHIRLMHTFDCTFTTMFVSLQLKYTSESDQHIRQVDLLLGYELENPTDVSLCTPLVYRQMKKNLSTFFLPLVILSIILIEILFTVYHRRTSARGFRVSLSKQSQPMGYKSWSHAFRFLSTSDPDSTDLVTIGKEQTRQILLTRYRRDGMLQPQCILQNGSFGRERVLFTGSTNENFSKINHAETSRRISGTVTKTLSERIFFNGQNQMRDIHSGEMDISVVLPYGLDWKRTAPRVISQHQKASPEKVRNQRSKLQDSNLSVEKVPKKSMQISVKDEQNHHDIAKKPNEKATIVLPQDPVPEGKKEEMRFDDLPKDYVDSKLKNTVNPNAVATREPQIKKQVVAKEEISTKSKEEVKDRAKRKSSLNKLNVESLNDKTQNLPAKVIKKSSNKSR